MTTRITTHSLLSGLGNDVPLLHLEEDRLDRGRFAEYFAQSIRTIDPQNGFVFALTGPWGSGKTTVLKFTEQLLRDHGGKDKGANPVAIIHFNAWWVSGSEKLLQDFFKQFRSGIKRVETTSDAVCHKLSSASKSLAKYAAALEPLPYIGRFAAVVHRLGKLKAARDADLNAARRMVDEGLKEFDGRIVVFIDDIDRLTPDEIRLIFRIVKAVANFPRTIYVLAFDDVQVSTTLSDKGGQDGREYIEKIIQLELVLPAPDRPSLLRWFLGDIGGFFSGTPNHLIDETELNNVARHTIFPLVNTPRHVVRFLNLLRATYPLVRGEVNAMDFLGVQALRLFTPEMHRFVADNKNALCGESDVIINESDEQSKARTYFQAALESATGFEREKVAVVHGILDKLFPAWSQAFGRVSRRSDLVHRNCRVCDADTFDRYFILGVPPGGLSEAEFAATMAIISDVQAFEGKLLELTCQVTSNEMSRLDAFIERMAKEQKLPSENVDPFLEVIYSVGDDLLLKGTDWNVGKQYEDFVYLDWEISNVVDRILKQFRTSRERVNVLERAFSKATALRAVVRFVIFLSKQHGEYGEQPLPESTRTVDRVGLADLKLLAVKRIRKAAAEGGLIGTPALGLVMHRFSEWASVEEAKSCAERLVIGDDGLCDYLVGFLREGPAVDNGGHMRGTTTGYTIDPEEISKFLDGGPNALLSRCESISGAKIGSLTKWRRIAIETFMEEIKQRSEPEVKS